MLDVHRIHLLTGAFGGTGLLDAAMRGINDSMISDAKRQEFHDKTYQQQTNLTGVAEFKRLLNYFIDYRFRPAVIDGLGMESGYRFDVERFYVPEKGLQNMAAQGMIIGSHTVTHPVKSRLRQDFQNTELKQYFHFLTDLGVINQKTYCHPYGGFHSFNQDTVEALDAENINYAFNVDPRKI